MKNLIFLFLIHHVRSDLAATFNCSELSLIDPHPSACCNYPISLISNTSIKTCYEECPSIKLSSESKIKADDKCCMMICLYKEEKILVENELNKESLRKSFKMSSMPILTDEWNGIIKHSVDSCVPLFEPSEERINGECLPDYFLNIVACIYNEMFLNCAGFDKKRQKCKNLLTIVNKCREQGYLSIKDWDEFYF